MEIGHEAVVNLIGSTTTTTGLRVRANLDKRAYETGRKVPKAVLRGLAIDRSDFHGEWNYAISPRTANSTP